MRLKNLTRRRRPVKKTNKRNKKRLRRTRKGGMWRLTPNKKLPRAELANVPADAIAHPYSGYDDYPRAEVEYTQYGKEDNASREEQLNDLYEDINNRGFPLFAEQKYALLKQYPDFNVNFKPRRWDRDNPTMLNQAIFQSTVGVAQAIINHPTISEQTLEEELQYINNMPKLNKSQIKIKKMIEDKLKNMRDNSPSAPPLEVHFAQSAPTLEDPPIPSAPPLQEYPIPSAPPLEDEAAYQIRNLDTGHIDDIRNLPNVPTHRPINLPNAPTNRPNIFRSIFKK